VQPNKELTARFSASTIQDDPPVECSGKPVECRPGNGATRTTGIKRGMVVYAGGGPDSRASDLWIARADSEHLGGSPWETPVGLIIEGIEVIDQIEPVGDMAPWGKGPDPGEISGDPTFTEKGFPGEYLKTGYPEVDYFKGCTLGA